MMSEHWSFTFTDFSLSRHSPMHACDDHVSCHEESHRRALVQPAGGAACVHGQAGCCQQTLRI